MGRDWFGMARRALRKPPSVVLKRVWAEANAELDRYRAPWTAGRLTETRLLACLESNDLDVLWSELAGRAYPAFCAANDSSISAALPAGCRQRILDDARKALNGRVDLLGSGPIELGAPVDWVKDYKTGRRWHNAYFRSIEYNNLEQPSDVKFPWELSRMQWMIPLGQAYVLTGDEACAQAARAWLESWIEDNPYACSVNWACTMEVALRIVSWTWFFHVFHASSGWRDPGFRFRFLQALYLHGRFTEGHLEESDVNGNHYTADAAGLVFAGLFFGRGGGPARWSSKGWDILVGEMGKQVTADGVDYEGSIPYHRLVMELFLWPALYRRRLGLEIPAPYREKLNAMSAFVEAYSRSDGSSPLLGDADDGRVLPFGGQPLTDHRYLCALVGYAFNVDVAERVLAAGLEELLWTFGPPAARKISTLTSVDSEPESLAFPDGGYYVMRNARDHVFIDCAPIGLAGRGGHGHNDCLSFEAMLDGSLLISDCGAYLYTADYRERNNFRSTAYHNTPRVDGQEINRFIRPDYLWNMHYDARPAVLEWNADAETARFRGSHSGYMRLGLPVVPVRTLALRHSMHWLLIHDEFQTDGSHHVEIPLHFAPGVELVTEGEKELLIISPSGPRFRLAWDGNYSLDLSAGRASPSYGVAIPVKRLLWTSRAGNPPPLSVCIAPHSANAAAMLDWAGLVLSGAAVRGPE